MRDLILAIEQRTTALAMFGAGLMLVIAAFSGLWQIVSRFILEQPAEWTEVTIRLSLIWMVFLGIPTAFRQGAMISVDLLYRKSGPRLRRVLEWLIFLASLVLMLAILWWGYSGHRVSHHGVGLFGYAHWRALFAARHRRATPRSPTARARRSAVVRLERGRIEVP